jgi:hypothetical protein
VQTTLAFGCQTQQNKELGRLEQVCRFRHSQFAIECFELDRIGEDSTFAHSRFDHIEQLVS